MEGLIELGLVLDALLDTICMVTYNLQGIMFTLLTGRVASESFLSPYQVYASRNRLQSPD